MFIEKLIISSHDKVIREMNFKIGLNLIIDKTPVTNDLKNTGNNVGKTTILKLINFCLGGDGKDIYKDEETKKNYDEVKNFLIDEEVLITLSIVKKFDSKEQENRVIIERNFLPGAKAIIRINGQNIAKKDLDTTLVSLFFPKHKNKKPSFRQIISHNVRYKDNNINNTLKTLNPYTNDLEYENLYLYLLGCEFNEGIKKQELTEKIKHENYYKERLENKGKKNIYESLLAVVDNEIKQLNKKKSLLNINENFEEDLNSLNVKKYEINKISSCIAKLELRLNIINDAKIELENKITNIDCKQLQLLYNEATTYMANMNRTFEDLVQYHNTMIEERISFMTKELPSLLEQIKNNKEVLNNLLKEEEKLTFKISKSDTFQDLENIISEINEKFRMKGEYESIIEQIKEVESKLENLNIELNEIDQYLYSKDFSNKIRQQVNKFNKYFTSISKELYDEDYILTHDAPINKKTNTKVYKFDTFNSNMSSGKKQGEIICFDLAYIMFADEQNIDCAHFLLNDKKELMHGHQLLKIADFIMFKNAQLVISVLKDKLPESLLKNKSNIVVELSQEDKLFRIN